MLILRTLMVFGLTVSIAFAALFPFRAVSQSPNPKSLDKRFMGKILSPSSRTYLTLRDVNVRKAPLTKSPRVSRFRKGVRVQAVGKAKGTRWVAVRKGGKNLGFIYGTALAAVLDGKLYSAISGTLTNSGQPDCNYTIKFDTKNKVKGDLQVTSDYQISLACSIDGKLVRFTATMFITELPYRDLNNEIYQVNVDLPRVVGDGVEFMSVISLYDHSKKQLVFEAVTNPNMARKANGLNKTVNSVPEVLAAALDFSHRIWGATVWKSIATGN